ncbi:MAG: DUF2520 domain-containing protein [Bacteroidales bacterium]|nr:DUF2520 domain-containing protein [Bacteroidales bacterium]HNW74726.1 DUF2520 domain-containing protein [Bacteroidales bacterium]HPS50390.1 DUF2520 domain-containing protein [Bacteroidales bacterium]
MIGKIVILGAGRLARHLAPAFTKKGYLISGIWNRSPEHGAALARLVNTRFIKDLSELPDDADLYLCIVSDSAIAEVAAGIPVHDRLIVHTSGSVSIDVLRPFSCEVGVFYPLQTFSNDADVDLTRVPVCVESASVKGMDTLLTLGQAISGHVLPVNSDDRRLLHLSAVMVSNFTNFLYTLASDLLSENQLPSGILNELILQTARNATLGHPGRFQTGPAIRNDKNVIENQLKILSKYPDTREIYQLFTENIVKYHSKHGQL